MINALGRRCQKIEDHAPTPTARQAIREIQKRCQEYSSEKNPNARENHLANVIWLIAEISAIENLDVDKELEFLTSEYLGLPPHWMDGIRDLADRELKTEDWWLDIVKNTIGNGRKKEAIEFREETETVEVKQLTTTLNQIGAILRESNPSRNMTDAMTEIVRLCTSVDGNEIEKLAKLVLLAAEAAAIWAGDLDQAINKQLASGRKIDGVITGPVIAD